VSDSFIGPTYHPAAVEDWNVLATYVERLNRHLLFASPDDALSEICTASHIGEDGPFAREGGTDLSIREI